MGASAVSLPAKPFEEMSPLGSVMLSNSKNIKHVPGLSHLRAYAALLVLCYHARGAMGTPADSASNPFWKLIVQGHTGVSLFLVLSGFVFELGARDRSVVYWPFIRNRLLRIYPLFVFLMVVAAYAAPDRFSLLGFLQSLLLLGNLPGSNVIGNWYVGATWTLMVEFQFYLLFPFLHRMFHANGVKWMLAVLLLLALVRVGVVLGGENNIRDLSYWTVLGRLDQILIGMGVARIHARLGPRARLVVGGLLPVAAGLVLAGASWLDRAGGYDVIASWKVVWMDLEAIVWALFLLSYLRAEPILPRRVSRAIGWLGELSYSMYLLHYLVAMIFQARQWYPHLSDNPNWNALGGGLLVLLPVTVAISLLTYGLVERPFLALRGVYLGPPLPLRLVSAGPAAGLDAASRSNPNDRDDLKRRIAKT
jgi:peptidoglycan/LPS O-acetylase OafA/YrhL